MLKRVKIQGYKSLADVEVHLQPLTVLFGPNASGKSNFLDALQLLSRIATSDNLNEAFSPPYRGAPLEAFTFGSDGVQGLLAQEAVSFGIEVDIELSQSTIATVSRRIEGMVGRVKTEGNDENIDVSILGELLANERYLRYRIEIEMLPITGTLSVATEHIDLIESSDELSHKTFPLLDRRGEKTLIYEKKWPYQDDKETIVPVPLQYKSPSDESVLPEFQYRSDYPYLVAIRQELARWFFYYLEPRDRMRIPDPVKEVHQIGQRGEELAAFLNTLRYLDEPQFRTVEKALHTLIPSITGIDVNINNAGKIDLSLLEGNTPVSINILSDGTLRILGLLALGGVKEVPSLLAFEEPENGIHPRSLDLIASLLETYAIDYTQVIATTHSPVLADLIPHESLYVCRKHNRHTSIEPFSMWEYPGVDKALNRKEDELPDLSVSERILRGDFDAKY
jgi:predicted ATPase